MKRILFFIGVCLCVVFSLVQGQEKEVFPTRNAEWTVCCNKSQYNYMQWIDYHVADYTVSVVNRDTVCNQKNYHVFKERGSKGGFRVDNAKVWITFDWEHEYLLYDFDVNVGDTIYHGLIYKEMPFYEASFSIENRRKFEVISVVNKIGYELGGKRLYLSVFLWNTSSYIPDWEYMGPDVWQEGVGSLKGLYMSWADMGSEIAGGHSFYSYYTRMVKREDEVAYFDSTIPEYPEVPDIRSLNELNVSELQVYYDESEKILFVHSENTDWKGVLSLYDLSGNRLFQIPVCSRVQVPLDSYSDGYYLCEIICGNRVIHSLKIRL